MASAIAPLEASVAARCAGSDAAIAPWCAELDDGIEIVRLRALHAAHLYRAVLDQAAGQPWAGDYAAAAADALLARAVIARREAHYRFSLFRDTADYTNPTVYGFGYLRTAHTACYWDRNEEQVTTLLTTGKAASPFSLPNCQN